MKPGAQFVKLFDHGGKPSRGKLLHSFYLTGKDFLSSAQGITNDGMFYYCTGTFVPLKHLGLTKIDMKTGVVVRARHNYLPEELAKQDFNHYGGCTYFEGKLYVAVEDLHRACPRHAGDWYFSGDYPTPGGNRVVNRALVNYAAKVSGRSY